MSDELIFLAVVLVILVLVCFVLDFVPSQKIEEVTGIVVNVKRKMHIFSNLKMYESSSLKI